MFSIAKWPLIEGWSVIDQFTFIFQEKGIFFVEEWFLYFIDLFFFLR